MVWSQFFEEGLALLKQAQYHGNLLVLAQTLLQRKGKESYSSAGALIGDTVNNNYY